jgi:hypothetical protein
MTYYCTLFWSFYCVQSYRHYAVFPSKTFLYSLTALHLIPVTEPEKATFFVGPVQLYRKVHLYLAGVRQETNKLMVGRCNTLFSSGAHCALLLYGASEDCSSSLQERPDVFFHRMTPGKLIQYDLE